MTLPAELGSCQLQPGATVAKIEAVERSLGQRLPDDYAAVLRETDGAEGFLSHNAYIQLWSTNDLPSLNEGYAPSEAVPGLVLIGTNGGNTGYGFRQVGPQHFEYIDIPLIVLDPRDLSIAGESFLDLLRWIVRHEE